MFDREQFIRDVREIAERGLPFRNQTCSEEVGVDCINLPRLAYERQGKLPAALLEEFRAYYLVPDGRKLLATMRKWFQEITSEKSQAGDLYVIYDRKNPCHVATRINDGDPPMIAEAYKSHDGAINKTLIQPLDYRRRVAAIFRIPDFT